MSRECPSDTGGFGLPVGNRIVRRKRRKCRFWTRRGKVDGLGQFANIDTKGKFCEAGRITTEVQKLRCMCFLGMQGDIGAGNVPRSAFDRGLQDEEEIPTMDLQQRCFHRNPLYVFLYGNGAHRTSKMGDIDMIVCIDMSIDLPVDRIVRRGASPVACNRSLDTIGPVDPVGDRSIVLSILGLFSVMKMA